MLEKVLFSVKWSTVDTKGDQGGRPPDDAPRGTMPLQKGPLCSASCPLQCLRAMKLCEVWPARCHFRLKVTSNYCAMPGSSPDVPEPSLNGLELLHTRYLLTWTESCKYEPLLTQSHLYGPRAISKNEMIKEWDFCLQDSWQDKILWTREWAALRHGWPNVMCTDWCPVAPHVSDPMSPLTPLWLHTVTGWSRDQQHFLGSDGPVWWVDQDSWIWEIAFILCWK